MRSIKSTIKIIGNYKNWKYSYKLNLYFIKSELKKEKIL